ncbi:MAG: hypothetical protein M1370_10295 [Bacteroidetes bacterium]|nr:hypothetical protein [Bacteroidota bacterium]
MQAQANAEIPVMGPDAAGEVPEVKDRPPVIKARRGPDLLIEPGVGDDTDDWRVVRFAGHQRAQHLIMMSSVLILVLTGMPQKFFNSPISLWLINFWGGLDSAQAIHHIAGFAMIFSALYHTVYLLYTMVVLKRPVPVWMLPNFKDFRDFWQNTGYYLGIVKEKPQFSRFSYFEKFDYWAVFWGVPVMGLTGLILMYPLIATRFLPGVTVPVATIAHSDEALLATGWLFVVHFYNAHFAPHIFPFNKSIFTGRVAAKRYRKEHPLEYQELVAKTEK